MEDRLTSSGLTKLWSKITACITSKIESNNSSIVDMIYPVGSIYMSMNNTSPETLFGGTWEKLAGGRCLMNTGFLDDDPGGGSISVAPGEKGGYKDTKLVSHNHGFEHRHYLNNDKRLPGTGDWDNQHGYLTYVLDSGVSRFKVAPSTASNARYVLGGVKGATSADRCGLTFSSYQNQMDNTDTDTVGNIEGSNSANYQPYIGVNMWKRTA